MHPTHQAPPEVLIPADGPTLPASLELPRRPVGVVVFAHGSGSSRHSPRNRHVAGVLQQARLGTLLLDLLTESEEQDRGNVFDIDLLADRLMIAIRWVAERVDTSGLPVGLFGASTGAAAALVAASREPRVRAVVSRGGRPDLAAADLASVMAPTLLIVGGEDDEVLELNRLAYARLPCEKHLTIVPGATHLFEEPGALDVVAALARDWFTDHLLDETER